MSEPITCPTCNNLLVTLREIKRTLEGYTTDEDAAYEYRLRLPEEAIDHALWLVQDALDELGLDY